MMPKFYRSIVLLLGNVLLLGLWGCSKGDVALLTRTVDPYAVNALPGLEVPPDFIFDQERGTIGARGLNGEEGIRATDIGARNLQSVDQADRAFLLKVGAQNRDPDIRKKLDVENVDQRVIEEVQEKNSDAKPHQKTLSEDIS